MSQAKQSNIGTILDKAMQEIEQENASLKGVLPKVYAKENLDSIALGGLIVLLSNLTSNTSSEGQIRKNLIESNLIECIINLPAKLFLNTQIPACLWFIRRDKSHTNTLFIDARNCGQLINRKNRILCQKDIETIAETYHKWQKNAEYEDIKGFCKSASIEEIAKLGFVLTPGRYVGLAEDEQDFDFESEFSRLKIELEKQIAQEQILSEKILQNLALLGD